MSPFSVEWHGRYNASGARVDWKQFFGARLISIDQLIDEPIEGRGVTVYCGHVTHDHAHRQVLGQRELVRWLAEHGSLVVDVFDI